MPKSTSPQRRPARPTSASDRKSSRLIPRQSEPVDDEPPCEERLHPIPIALLILMITLIVGLLPAVVFGLTAGLHASSALGLLPSIAVGVATAVVTLVLTGLVVANKLHKLVRYRLVEASMYSKAHTRGWRPSSRAHEERSTRMDADNHVAQRGGRLTSAPEPTSRGQTRDRRRSDPREFSSGAVPPS